MKFELCIIIEISERGLILPTRALKYGYQDTKSAKNLRKNYFSSSNGGLAFTDGGYSSFSAPLAPPLLKLLSIYSDFEL